jgi:hypothetical protein
MTDPALSLTRNHQGRPWSRPGAGAPGEPGSAQPHAANAGFPDIAYAAASRRLDAAPVRSPEDTGAICGLAVNGGQPR